MRVPTNLTRASVPPGSSAACAATPLPLARTPQQHPCSSLSLAWPPSSPQTRRILSRGDGAGISLTYVLCNLIAVTEQFALGLHYVVDSVEGEDGIVNRPVTAGDWLNLWPIKALVM